MRRAFDTMENLFFKEGDELDTPAPAEPSLDEVTEVCHRPKRKRVLAAGVAMAVVALVVLAVLVF
jgi:hypothetical protein